MLVLFAAELNQLDFWGNDIENVFLEVLTKDKVYIKPGKECVPLEGHELIISNDLCGLHTSGLRWHEMLSDCLRDMGYEPCTIDPDIWLRDGWKNHEHIAVCVDDLMIASKNPQGVVDALRKKHHFKLKG